MKEFTDSLPLELAIAFLYVVVLCRAGGTYAISRGLIKIADRKWIHDFLESDQVQRATQSLNRWGAPLVALSFLTVGFQTAVNAAAGLIRMPLKRYIPALLIGGLAWATIYATVGLAAFWLWFAMFAESPVAAFLLLFVVIALVIYFVLRRRQRRRTGDLG